MSWFNTACVGLIQYFLPRFFQRRTASIGNGDYKYFCEDTDHWFSFCKLRRGMSPERSHFFSPLPLLSPRCFRFCALLFPLKLKAVLE